MNRRVVFLPGKWIGFKGISITGEEKNFLWARNLPNDPIKVKNYIGLIMLSSNPTDVLLGPGVNYRESMANNEVVLDLTSVGLYVEERRREGFNLFSGITDNFFCLEFGQELTVDVRIKTIEKLEK